MSRYQRNPITGSLIPIAGYQVADDVLDANSSNPVQNKVIADIIADNAGAHNCIYRGKNLGTSVTAAQWAEIAAGTFKNLYIGDYWYINGKTWRIAAFDYWLNTGVTGAICTAHHVVIVPDENLKEADGSTTHYMNTSNITTGAYIGSGFYSGTNVDNTPNTAKADCQNMIKAAFGDNHILVHKEYLKNATTDGYESYAGWYDSDVELMTEEMVYGCKEFKNIASGINVPWNYTIDNSQLPLFSLDHSKICNRARTWLRDVVSSTDFADVDYSGNADHTHASYAGIGIRPAFGIC